LSFGRRSQNGLPELELPAVAAGTDRRQRDCVGMARKPDVVDGMSAEQGRLLRQLAFDAYEPEAFAPNLTSAEAERRIQVLRAKLKLMSEPPHTQ
jgi:hypothetical protein